MPFVRPSPFMARAKAAGLFFAKDLKSSHKYGCLMALIPPDVAKEITSWARKAIPQEHLEEEGFEDKCHVTIKYGFKDCSDKTINVLKGMLLKQGPFPIKIKGLSLFEGNEDGDVLKADIDSPVLHELNEIITKNFDVYDKYPEYLPHLTIAYLKPEFSKKYTKEKPSFIGKETTIEEVEFSDKEKNKQLISLVYGTQFKDMSWLNESQGGALVKPPAFPFAEKKEEKRLNFQSAFDDDALFIANQGGHYYTIEPHNADTHRLEIWNQFDGGINNVQTHYGSPNQLREQADNHYFNQQKSLYQTKGVRNNSVKPSPFIALQRNNPALSQEPVEQEVAEEEIDPEGHTINLNIDLRKEHEEDVPWQEERKTVPSASKRKKDEEKQGKDTKRRGLLMAGVMDKLFDPALIEEYRDSMMGGALGNKGMKKLQPGDRIIARISDDDDKKNVRKVDGTIDHTYPDNDPINIYRIHYDNHDEDWFQHGDSRLRIQPTGQRVDRWRPEHFEEDMEGEE